MSDNLMFLFIIFQNKSFDGHDNVLEQWTVWILGILKHAGDFQNTFALFIILILQSNV